MVTNLPRNGSTPTEVGRKANPNMSKSSAKEPKSKTSKAKPVKKMSKIPKGPRSVLEVSAAEKLQTLAQTRGGRKIDETREI